MFLEVSNLKKQFQNTEVLKGVDFALEKGEVLSIIGSSGSGKTTLLRCLNFLEIPDSGRICLQGDSLFDSEKQKAFSEQELRQKRLHFGLVFQQFHLFPQYTAQQNIALAPTLLQTEQAPKSAHAAIKQRVQQEALQRLDQVGLLDKADAYPCQLSGGQQQRVAIARALALQPDILCFDEPTSALDPELTGEVLRVIRELRSTHTTMVIVTHEMDFAYSVSDRIIFMAEGVVAVQGTPQEVFEHSEHEKIQAFLQKKSSQ